MGAVLEKLEQFPAYLLETVLYPLDADHRVYVLYLATSAIIAYLVYRKIRQRGTSTARSFLRFLFPKEVWRHPSAWLDVRYFFFHQLIGHFLMVGLGLWATTVSFGWVTGGGSMDAAAVDDGAAGGPNIGTTLLYMVVFYAVADFIAYAIHYFQHKLPILWHFHKVHHSAEVLHPLSNFREHPIDNLVYKVVIGLGMGVVVGVATNLTGHAPSLPTLLGVPLLMFAFNFVGYNLRHSHIWLRWPGRWSMVFPSPAHHQIHHSYHADHIDKNFAFMFPIWDVIFGTYCMPADNRDVRFGVGEGQAEGLTSCVRLYLVPFRDAGRDIHRAVRRRIAARRSSSPGAAAR